MDKRNIIMDVNINEYNIIEFNIIKCDKSWFLSIKLKTF